MSSSLATASPVRTAYATVPVHSPRESSWYGRPKVSIVTHRPTKGKAVVSRFRQEAAAGCQNPLCIDPERAYDRAPFRGRLKGALSDEASSAPADPRDERGLAPSATPAPRGITTKAEVSSALPQGANHQTHPLVEGPRGASVPYSGWWRQMFNLKLLA